MTPAYSGSTYTVSTPVALSSVAPATDGFEVVTSVGRGDGGFVTLINREIDAYAADVSLQFVNASRAVSASFSLTATATSAYYGSGLERLADGRFLLTYAAATRAGGVYTDSEVYRQIFDANGAAVGAATAITADAAAGDGAAAFVAAGDGFFQFYERGVPNAGGFGDWSLRVQKLDANGQPTGAPTVVWTAPAGHYMFGYAAKSLASGGSIIFWKEKSPDWDGAGQAPAGFTQSWSVRYAMLDAAGALTSSGQLETGALTSDGVNLTGSFAPDITAVDLANGGAALKVDTQSVNSPTQVNLYTFDRAGLIAADFAAPNLPVYSNLAIAADGSTLVLSSPFNPATSSTDLVGSFVSIAARGVVGGAGADTLYGDAVVADILSGGAGNDNLFGLSGADTLNGGDGNDWLNGGAGADILQGDAGFDTADYSDAPGGVTVYLSIAGPQNTVAAGSDTLSSIEGLIGSAFFDRLFGDGANNMLVGGAGNDALYGEAGDDALSGGDGNDVLVGGVGNDTMQGGAGNDSIFAGDGLNYGYGGDGNDVLVGGKDFNVLSGDAGDDYMYLYNAGGQAYGGAGNDVAVGNNANDVFVMGDGNDVAYGYGANDYFYMGAGADVMYGGDGVDVLLGEAGGDYFDGGAGIDYLFLGASDGAVDTVYMDRASGIDVVNNFEAGRDVLRLVGTSFTGMSDVLAATSDYGSFSIVTIDANTAVWLIGVTPAQLAASSVALG